MGHVLRWSGVPLADASWGEAGVRNAYMVDHMAHLGVGTSPLEDHMSMASWRVASWGAKVVPARNVGDSGR